LKQHRRIRSIAKCEPLPLPTLVFCRSRKGVEGVARELGATLGWDRVGAYHAGLTKEERSAIESWFFSATDAVLVATCAYGIPSGSCIDEL
jgi:ATP-dependent DNA helicase RecQ